MDIDRSLPNMACFFSKIGSTLVLYKNRWRHTHPSNNYRIHIIHHPLCWYWYRYETFILDQRSRNIASSVPAAQGIAVKYGRSIAQYRVLFSLWIRWIRYDISFNTEQVRIGSDVHCGYGEFVWMYHSILNTFVWIRSTVWIRRIWVFVSILVARYYYTALRFRFPYPHPVVKIEYVSLQARNRFD